MELTQRAIDFIASQAYDPVYGARPLKRYLQKNVETLLARKILGDQLNRGEVVKIDEAGGRLYTIDG